MRKLGFIISHNTGTPLESLHIKIASKDTIWSGMVDGFVRKEWFHTVITCATAGKRIIYHIKGLDLILMFYIKYIMLFPFQET